MKKIVIATLLSIFMCFAIFAQQASQPEIEDKEDAQSTGSEEMAAIQTAMQLAKYGYQNGSASALLCAAEILAQVPKQEMKEKGEASEAGVGADDAKTSDAKPYTAEKLLEDGKKYAGKDKTLLAYAKSVEKIVKSAGTRGAFGGPGWGNGYVYGKSKTSYYNVGFYANRYAEVSVYSYDGADLDVYVYDENWNLVTKDTSYNCDAYVGFRPRWDGIFHIVIKNNSRYTCYFEMYTN